MAIFDFSILRKLRKEHKMNIMELAEKSGVSAPVISKLERNQNNVEAVTLFRLARALGLSSSELLNLAEAETSVFTDSKTHESGDFTFQQLEGRGLQILYGVAKAGGKTSRPELHSDDYELCWVLQGKLQIKLPTEQHELVAGQSIEFDALQEHSYDALEDCAVVILHIRKRK